MDGLYKRYSHPLELLGGMLACGEFAHFVTEFVQKINNEDLYEVWLHKVYEKSFDEFKQSVINNAKNARMTEYEKTRAIRESNEILANFNPMQE